MPNLTSYITLLPNNADAAEKEEWVVARRHPSIILWFDKIAVYSGNWWGWHGWGPGGGTTDTESQAWHWQVWQVEMAEKIKLLIKDPGRTLFNLFFQIHTKGPPKATLALWRANPIIYFLVKQPKLIYHRQYILITFLSGQTYFFNPSLHWIAHSHLLQTHSYLRHQ